MVGTANRPWRWAHYHGVDKYFNKLTDWGYISALLREDPAGQCNSFHARRCVVEIIAG